MTFTVARAFHLEVGADRLATLTFDLPDKKVNIFSRGVLEELDTVISDLALRRDIGCLVLLSAKPGTFIAGADVEAIANVTDPVEAEAGSRWGHRLFSAWETLPFPTVAAVDGTCLGGGTELALASTFLVASDGPDVRIGLPEVRLGILPGWGGCVRLPRKVGALAALDIILAGKAVPGRQAAKIGLADALLPAAGFLHYVRDFAARHADRPRRTEPRRRDLRHRLLEGNPLGRMVLFDQARKKTLAQTKGHYPAPLRALEVVRTGVERGPSAGFDAEARAIGQLAVSPVTKSLIHVFRLMERSKREDGTGGTARAVREPAVVGAGIMGGGITQLIADRTALSVRIRDIQPAALTTAVQHAAGLWDKQTRRRRLSPTEARRRMALLRPSLDLAGWRRCDLVVEAVVENLAVKQQVLAEVAASVASDAVLASNTSSLSIDAIARDTPNPERVVGMHFFNPVDKMPLVEVVVGPRSSPDAVATVAAFARRLGKTPVVVRECPGFLVNRLLAFYSAEAMWLLDEGHRIEDIDRAMLDFGMPMGPLRLGDEVGLDVSAKVAHILLEAFPDRLVFPGWLDRLADSGRLGVKSGRGIYVYDGRRQLDPDPAIYAVLGLSPTIRRPDLPALAERMVLPMVNEAARCLAEGIVAGPEDLDLAMIMGTGFPPFRGGLCRWADGMGLSRIVDKLERLAATGERLRPSPNLVQIAAAGGFYASGQAAAAGGRPGAGLA